MSQTNQVSKPINTIPPIQTETLLVNLFKSFNHLGCDKNKTNQMSYPYIYGVRSKQCIINLTITAQMLLRTLKFIQLAYQYKTIKTSNLPKRKKKQQRKIGIICNTIYLRALSTYLIDTRLMNKFDIITQKWVTGVLTTNKINYDFIIVFDVPMNSIVINEAAKKKIPVIALIDTDQNPHHFTYPIVTNTKNIKSIFYLIQIFDKFLQNLK